MLGLHGVTHSRKATVATLLAVALGSSLSLQIGGVCHAAASVRGLVRAGAPAPGPARAPTTTRRPNAAWNAARIPRYLFLAWLGTRLGAKTMPYLRQHAWQFALLAAGLFGSLYLVIRFLHQRTLAKSPPSDPA